jgi:23S rRNA pseudouridine1911/1915/1917 synthase
MSAQRFTGVGGERLDKFLTGFLAGSTRAHARSLVERGFVTVDGTVRPPDFRLKGGEIVRLTAVERGWPEMDFESWVLHEDRDLLVLNKPAGLLIHPLGTSWLTRPEASMDEPEPNLAGLLLKHRPKAAASGVERCGIVHRLDRPTSGALLVAKTSDAQHLLLAAFRDRTVHKTYRAVVLGTVAEKSVDAPIGRATGRRKVKVTPYGREASTAFRTVSKAGDVSMVEAMPLTGRTHQIRAHLAVLGHPVLGDTEAMPGEFQKAFEATGLPEPPRLLLHAYKLTLDHPGTGRPASYSAKMPHDMTYYWALCRKHSK